jgi:ribosomal subunit interface protein
VNYNIKGTNMQVTDELRTYVERQLAHADKLLGGDSTAHADVELEFNALNDGGKYRAEFTVGVGGTVYRASEWGGTLHEAIDLAAGELTQELRQEKSKRLHIFRHTGVKVKEFLRGWRRKV